ncbi:MAG TPA: acyl-CoA reductase [Oscillatoriaceae cyanobacterium]
MRTHYAFGRHLTGELSADDVRALIAEGRDRQAALRAQPIEAILLLLEKVGETWADPNYAPRQRVLAELPAQIGFSREMVELELSGLTMALTRPYLEAKLTSELGRLDAQDVFQRRGNVFQKALPRGLVLHVASGNVSTTGVLSLLEGLLTRNVNMLKVASNAPLMPLLFAETLAELDTTGAIANSFAILSWSGEHTPHHTIFQQEADAIVVWGGEEVVNIYRQGLSLRTRLVEYGPKFSAALLDAAAIAPERLAETAAKAARDVSLWDQSACSSPQVIYIEDSSPTREGLTRFLGALAPALDAVAAELPMGALSMQEKAEITKERELALADELMGLGRLIRPAGQSWTIVAEYDPTFKLSPLFRTIYMKPVPRLEDALPHLAPYRDYLQTIALAVTPSASGPLAEAAFATGALRVTRLGEMSGGYPGEPHDGLFGLAELVKWVSLDTPEAADAFDGTIFLSAEQERAITLAKRRRMVESTARRSPFYQRHWGRFDLETEDDWLALPLMSKTDVVANTPPNGTDLLTHTPNGGHWLRSGGSSGDPKLSIYTYEDYEDDMWRAARGAHAAGVRRGEKVANLFFAGDLYGSFLSLNRTLEVLGCNSFPFTNHAPVESVLTCLREFGIETVIGLSSWVQAVLVEAMRDPKGIRVKHVLYAGEHFHEKERRVLMDGLAIERVTSIGYGAVDAGPMGYQCAHCTGSVHHVHADHVYLEILDPHTHAPVGPDAIGEVVVSNLNRRLMPLVRYRIGDMARWVPEPCPCGRPGLRFELLGRVEETIYIAGTNFQYREVQGVVEQFGELHSSAQLVLAGNALATSLAIRAELVGQGVEAESLAQRLREGLVSRIGPLSAAEVALQVEVLPTGSLERVGRTGKIMRIIDHRIPTPKADGVPF